MLDFILLGLISFIDYKKQEFSEQQALLFCVLFFIISLIQGINIINFIVLFVLILFLIKKNILFEGDLLIACFALTFTHDLVWLLMALGLGYCFTIFYKEITHKTKTGFIPYFFISLLLLTPLILI